MGNLRNYIISRLVETLEVCVFKSAPIYRMKGNRISRKEDFKSFRELLGQQLVDLGVPQLVLLRVWSVDKLLQITWELIKNGDFGRPGG